MEVKAFKVNKLEATKRHRSPQQKEIFITSDSPPDVGRPLVPPEDLDRVDGIRPSSSRTRAVALLPAIQESLEEGSESQQEETREPKSKNSGPCMSTKPVLLSISEERIPRLWEYPIGETNTEKDKPPGYSLGAGEASTLQPRRDHLSPVMFDKNLEGDSLLVEAGDAETREGNRSNHALGDPNSRPGERDNVGDEIGVEFTVSSSGDTVQDLGLENTESAQAVGEAASSLGGSRLNSSCDDMKQLRMYDTNELQMHSQTSLMKFTNRTNEMHSQEEVKEMENGQVLKFSKHCKQEACLKEFVSGDNGNIDTLRLVGTAKSPLENAHSTIVMGCSEYEMCEDEVEHMKEISERVNSANFTKEQRDSTDYAKNVSESLNSLEIVGRLPTMNILEQGNIESSDNHFTEEDKISMPGDSMHETLEMEFKGMHGDSNSQTDNENSFKKEFQTNGMEIQNAKAIDDSSDLSQVPNERIKENAHVANFNDEASTIDFSVRSLSDSDQNGTIYLKEETSKRKMIPSAKQTMNAGESRTNISLCAKRGETSYEPFHITNFSSASLDKGKTERASEVQDEHGQDSLCNPHCGRKPDKNKSSSLCADGFEFCTTVELNLTEAMVKETTSQEDSFVSSSVSSRAKGSGSDSMVADGNLSVVDLAGARESHSDHTSCSEKVDQTAKIKDGSAKTRGRERERSKRKRSDRDDREERGGSPGDKQKLLKNAVGDVQVVTDEARDVDADNMVLVPKNTPINDIGWQSRTHRATRSGDIRDNAIKSTCGLESQTVTSLDDSPDETTEQISLWEQDQTREDSSSFGRPQTPTKGIATSRFGKRTQLNRQKQSSPQEQDLISQSTEKVDTRVLGLGDSRLESSAKATYPPFTSPNASVGVVQHNVLSNIGQNESCNNPTDPFTTIDNPECCLQAEVSVDDKPLVCPETPAGNQCEEQNLQDIENRQREFVSHLVYSSIIISPNEINSDQSENLLNDVDSSARSTEVIKRVENLSPPEMNLLKNNDDSILELDNKSMHFIEGDRENIMYSTENETKSLSSNDTTNSIFYQHESNAKDLNFSYDFQEGRSESAAIDGANCCHQCESFDNYQTGATTTNSETSSQNSTVESSGGTSKTSGSVKAQKDSQGKSKKRLSNFNSLFPPRVCSGDLCVVSSDTKHADLKAKISQNESSKPQPSSPIEVNQHSSQSDFLQMKDYCNPVTAHESSAQTLIFSEDQQRLHNQDLIDEPRSAETWQESCSYKFPQTFEKRRYDISLQEEQSTQRDIGCTQVSQNSRLRDNEMTLALQEGLHIPHIDGNHDEIALINALAEAAEDCSLSKATYDNAQECVSLSNTSKINERKIFNEDVFFQPESLQSQNDLRCKETTQAEKIENSAECDKLYSSANFKNMLENAFSDPQTEVTATPGDLVSVIEPRAQEESLGTLMELNTGLTLIQAENRHIEHLAEIGQTPSDDVYKQLDSKLHENQVDEEHSRFLQQTPQMENTTTEIQFMSETAETGAQEQVPYQEDSLDKGDFPITFKVPDDSELCNQSCPIDNELSKGEERRPNIEHQVLTVFQGAAPLASPYLPKRPNTPVAGDGDCVEKEDSESLIKQKQSDWIGEAEIVDSEFQFLSEEAIGEKEKRLEPTSCDYEVMTGGDVCLGDELDLKIISIEIGSDIVESTTYQMKDSSEDSKDTICLLDQEISTDNLDTSKYQAKCIEQLKLCTSPKRLSLGANSTAISSQNQSKTHLYEKNGGGVAVESTKGAVFNRYENADVGYENSSHDNVWADMVIREVDKVCEDYHQNQLQEGIREQFLTMDRSENPSLEELALETSLGLSHNKERDFQNSLTQNSMETDIEILGRSKDGGKRAKRSKPYVTLEKEATTDRLRMSDNHVRRITLVDVEVFPNDRPCVYHPDREGVMKEREKTVTRPGIKRDRDIQRKRMTIWRRIKTMFHPRRLVSKERKERIERERSTAPNVAQDIQAKSEKGPSLHLRQPAKSDDTLDTLQGDPVRDCPARLVESCPDSHHKGKCRPSGQWRRLKKFRALRQSAERRSGRLPPTMRQVVSKNNYVREAQGDNKPTSRQDAKLISQCKRESTDVPMLKQTQRSSRSAPEVTEVLRMDDHPTNFHFSPGQPNVRSLLKPDPEITFPKKQDDFLSHNAVDGKEQSMEKLPYKKKFKEGRSKGNKVVLCKWERHESDNVLELNRGSKKVNTYHCQFSTQDSICNAKQKANTHPCGAKNQSLKFSNEGSRPNKNCRLM